MPGRLPDFIVVGAMKCATSTLHEQLGAQPGIFMSTPKEPCFFSNDEVYRKDVEWYCSLFDKASENDLCGESSTHYTKLPTYPCTVERMRRHVPHTKLIYVMRHPIDRLVSHYVHDWTEGKISSPIDQAINEHPELIAYSCYAMQLEPFLEAYGCARVLSVFFERLLGKPQAELERICRFLGYRSGPSWVQELGSVNQSSQRLRRSQIRDALVWNPVSTFIRRRFIPQAWRDGVKRLWEMRDRPELSPANRIRLTEVFNEDLAQLGSWLGLKLSCGTFKAIARNEVPEWRRVVAEKPA